MVQINFALKEVNCKVVYYGCGLSGKTTNLEVVHGKAPTEHVGELTSIATEGDRTLFFDFLPLNLGHVAGMNTKFQIYTVPGQVYYNSTRKLVLQGADGIVFVADSRRGKMDENIESLLNLEENLREYGMDINTIPLVLQYNKRDLPDVYPVEEINEKLNRFNAPYYEAVAVTGEGVFPTLKKVSSMVLESLNRQQGSTSVRVPKKQKQPAQNSAPANSQEQKLEPVAVGASAETASASASAGGGPKPTAAAAQSVRGSAEGQGTPVVRDRVVKSPDVKPIERRRPPQAVTSRKENANAPAKAAGGGGSKAGLFIGIAVAVLAAAGAAAYFTGMLDSFIK